MGRDSSHSHTASTYQNAGVDAHKAAAVLTSVREMLRGTFSLARPGGKPRLDLGYFANVLELDGSTGLAISVDNVGTKVLVAQRMARYRTIGIDCVAINVNDLLCVGARPTALVDYVAVERLDETVFTQIVEGLCDGAYQARVSIAGGETAQVPHLLRGDREGSGLDLVGTAVGLVDLDKIIIGQDLADGDVIVSLAGSGLHCNGFTLARKVLFDGQGWDVDRHVAELGCTLGEELLRPTRIYVQPVLAMLEAGLRIKAILHITGDGLLNLLRTQKPAGFVIEHWPELPPIFRLIQEVGRVSDAEMFRVFNMGIGMCVVTDPADADRARSIASQHQIESFALGHVTLAATAIGKVHVAPYRLVSDTTGRGFMAT